MSGARTTGALLAAALLFFATSSSAEITAGARWADPSRVDLSVAGEYGLPLARYALHHAE